MARSRVSENDIRVFVLRANEKYRVPKRGL